MDSAPLVDRWPATTPVSSVTAPMETPPITGSVVGAVDGDGDDLAGRTIERDRGEAVGDRLAGAELLDRGLAIVGSVGPVAQGVEREGAVAVVAGGGGLDGEIGLALVDIGNGKRAAGG